MLLFVNDISPTLLYLLTKECLQEKTLLSAVFVRSFFKVGLKYVIVMGRDKWSELPLQLIWINAISKWQLLFGADLYRAIT